MVRSLQELLVAADGFQEDFYQSLDIDEKRISLIGYRTTLYELQKTSYDSFSVLVEYWAMRGLYFKQKDEERCSDATGAR